MQKECAMLISSLNKELEDLRLLAQQTSQRRATLGKSLGGSRKREDLGNTSKWGLNDAAQFGQLLKQYEQDLVELKEKREKQKQMLRELQRSMLKAGTRREEIVRFNKAKNDAEFAKMLRARTLGPEHLETQTQLRRNIRIMRDRIQKLEANLQASKKKLAQSTTGKPGFRAPSLDTINRTYRNIDLAIQQQSADVSDLASRISKLKISGSSSGLITRDARLPDVVSKRPYNVTPHVAITTAAALNAERSANRLKRALLSVRKEPLLNTKAVTAPAPPVAFSTPQKAPGFGFQTPPGSLFAVPSSNEALATPVPSWNLPEDNFNPSTPQATRRGAGSGQKKHSSVALKRSPGMSPTPAAPAFDWGPLPSFNAPLNSLAMGVKIGSPGGSTSGSNGESSLGGSWIKDGFGKKA
ncbi:hypothetical protein BDQ12DRAFT_602582 [Crucibulum laeve]|uniref:Uncharacterized protein n=1 Tax=Crucibulum laeve TaxID=68775 RepID=A0A5C3M733_9AGAR|nr:hypothetical protein BDQ12DRAFT_602582 [Crucibulum laeve]